MNDPELETAKELRERARVMSTTASQGADRKLLLKAADQIEDLVKRLDDVWQQSRFNGD